MTAVVLLGVIAAELAGCAWCLWRILAELPAVVEARLGTDIAWGAKSGTVVLGVSGHLPAPPDQEARDMRDVHHHPEERKRRVTVGGAKTPAAVVEARVSGQSASLSVTQTGGSLNVDDAELLITALRGLVDWARHARAESTEAGT